MATTVSNELKSRVQARLWFVLVMVLLIVIAILLSGWPAEDDEIRGRPAQTQAGKLFVVEFAPANSQLNIFAAGNPTLELKPDAVSITAQTYPLEGPQDAEVHWSGDNFIIRGPLEDTQSIEIEVRDLKSEQREAFRFGLE